MAKRLRVKNRKTKRDVASARKAGKGKKHNKSSVRSSRKGKKRISNAAI